MSKKTAITDVCEALEIGDIVKNGENKGWIFAGISDDLESPGYDEPLFAAPEDFGVMTHYEAECVVAELHRKGCKDRLATPRETDDLLFNNLAKKGIGGFNRNTFNSVAGNYWTSKRGKYEDSGKVKDKNQYVPGNPAQSQSFSDGVLGNKSRHCRFSVRLVR